MASLVRTLGRQSLLQQQWCFMQKRVAQASSNTSVAYTEMSKYWEKNRKLQRPISPHLTVFKPHLPMMSSITFRITGVAVQVAATGASLCLLALPGDFSHYLEMVKNLELGPAVISSLKLLVVFPVVYHFINGIRHLVWDAGFGFSKQMLQKSSVAVWVLTVIFTVYFALYY
ncbi:succinate dehydrogenase cytochrome b560 subunit, mitochondrial-like [Babylonia areolata]|uniref:succinate dehydrogenase cytochrome b560 subunit, mitochondrial-like n=1 Tax=Babylonia areolata TaxID=304850 RepID=UPI003FD573F0